MTRVARAGRGWKLWSIFALGLAAAPLNAFAILFGLWISTHHLTDTTTQDTIGAVALGVLAAAIVADIAAMVRRWDGWVWGLSVLQLVPAVLILAVSVIGIP